LEPETQESRSKAQKTQTRALFPMKTSVKHFGLAVGPKRNLLVPDLEDLYHITSTFFD